MIPYIELHERAIELIAGIPLVFLSIAMLWRCLNVSREPDNWELIDKTILPSRYEVIRNGNQVMKQIGADLDECSKTLIFTFKNKRNGKIKQTEFHS